MNDIPNVLHVTDMAAYLRVSEQTIRSLLRSGEIEGAKHVGRIWMVSKDNWLKFVNG